MKEIIIMGLIKGLVIFAAGAYTGIYACQHYNVPPMDEPKEIWKKIQEFLKEHEKPENKSDKK